MNARRFLRWTLFWAAASAMVRFVFFDNEDMKTLAGFFLAGGLWVWLERCKMTELDALIKKGPK